jgi:outer membrane protein OmpA-like peptidoglycan-associated protein
MLKQIVLLFIMVLFCLNFKAQIKIDTLRLFFEINQSQSEHNQKRIDSMITALNGKIVNVKVYGYADFLHSNKYNQNLSQRRAETAKKYFVSKIDPNQLANITTKALGESLSTDNQSAEGDAYNRRVDMIIEPFTIASVDYRGEVKQSPKAPKSNAKTIEELEKGESLAVEGLNFEPGRHYLVKEAMPVLNKLLKTLQTKKSLKIQIQGHICCLTDEEDGMDLDTHEKKLSENRAKAIYDFLIQKGIDASRLSYKGFGRSQPKISPETTPEEEQINRRVEVMVIEK